MPRPQLRKGSPEAFAWAERMRLARQARGKRIRRAGRKLERRFFRKGKLKRFAGMELNEPRRPQPKRGFHILDTVNHVSVGFYKTLHAAQAELSRCGLSSKRFKIVDEYYTLAKNPGRPHGTFTSCVKKVRASLKRYHRKGKPEAICGAALSKKKHRKNPIAVFGNPGRRINAAIEGIIYNRVEEIRAQKTTWKRGFYRHPFEHDVQLLALDNGDLLVHSIDGRRLWDRS